MYEKEGFLEMGVSPIAAPDEPTYVTLDFEKGIPVALDGEKMTAKEIILKLKTYLVTMHISKFTGVHFCFEESYK
jgi:argininosuccinate synthase